jgi:hypothetical protein
MEHEPIPGELDPSTETDLPHPLGAELTTSDSEDTLTDHERREREREGGGAPSQRHHRGGKDR